MPEVHFELIDIIERIVLFQLILHIVRSQKLPICCATRCGIKQCSLRNMWFTRVLRHLFETQGREVGV